MKEHKDQELEKLIDKAIKMSTLEIPSADFTSMVMSRVENISTNKATVYKPLISKGTWIIISLGILAFYIYLVLQSSPSGWINYFNFNFLYHYKLIDIFSSIEISKITFYGVLFSSLMLLFQVIILKYYFNKRLGV
jgi:hypothetical protein